MTLNNLKRASHEDLKKWIIQALEKLPSKSCQQYTLVSKICALKNVSTLRGRPRLEFEKKVDKAVRALLRKREIPFLVRPKSKSPYIKLIKRKIY